MKKLNIQSIEIQDARTQMKQIPVIAKVIFRDSFVLTPHPISPHYSILLHNDKILKNYWKKKVFNDKVWFDPHLLSLRNVTPFPFKYVHTLINSNLKYCGHPDLEHLEIYMTKTFMLLSNWHVTRSKKLGSVILGIDI